MKTTIRKGALTVPRYRTERTDNGNGSVSFNHMVPDGTRSGTVEVRIDVDRLFQVLGSRALKSRGGKCRVLSGIVEVVARNVMDVTP